MNAASDIEQVLEAAPPHKVAPVMPLTLHHENYQS